MCDRQSRTKRVNRGIQAAPGVLVLALGIALAGCTVGPQFASPQADLPAAWRDAFAQATDRSMTTEAQVDPRWWRAYGDPMLNSLVERALAGNLSAGQTVYRIAESRAQERATAAAGLPSLKTTGSLTHEKSG
jgi:outer membrane protein TolC